MIQTCTAKIGAYLDAEADPQEAGVLVCGHPVMEWKGELVHVGPCEWCGCSPHEYVTHSAGPGVPCHCAEFAPAPVTLSHPPEVAA